MNYFCFIININKLLFKTIFTLSNQYLQNDQYNYLNLLYHSLYFWHLDFVLVNDFHISE